MSTATASMVEHVEFVMGMAVSLDIRDDVDAAVLQPAIEWLHQVDATYSTHRADSPVSRFGLGELSADELEQEVRFVLALCDHYFEDSNGFFDIASVPAPNGSHLDPSGLVKGWSIERAAEILVEQGCRNFTINGGGDIAIRGEMAPGQPWTIGVRHPDDPTMLAASLLMSGAAAIATSATYERGAHIIDPRTGEPTADLASVTITGTELTLVDVAATTVFAMGLDGLAWLMDRHPECEGFAITHDGLTFETPGFDRLRA